MTTRRLFVPKNALAADEVVVEGEGHHHVARVLRAARGDLFVLFDGEGLEVDARIVAIDKQRTRLLVEGRRNRVVPRGARLTLCQGLIRPEPMDWVVQKATELGVSRIEPTLCARSQGHGRERQERWERIAREAARQCGRPDVPVIGEVLSWSDVVKAPRPLAQKLVLWEDSRDIAPLSSVVRRDATEIVLAIGPEGGFEADEAELAVREGFALAGLGPRILRAETAAVVALGLAQALTGGLG